MSMEAFGTCALHPRPCPGLGWLPRVAKVNRRSHPVLAAPTCTCVQALPWRLPASSPEHVLSPALLMASLPLTCPSPPLWLCFFFSRKSVRGKGKGQKRKRKKSRYKSWNLYVVPLLSHSLEPPQGPLSNSRLQDPLTLPPPSVPPFLPLILPSAPVSHSLILTPLIGTNG